MPEAPPAHRSRRHVRLVLAILGLLALVGPADASTCHAPERPTFGTNDSPMTGDRTSDDPAELIGPAPVHYDQAPCPGDSAGFPLRLQIPRATLAATPWLAPIPLVERRWVEPSELDGPLALSNPPERPPRDLPIPLPA